jgi:hypothetical protein
MLNLCNIIVTYPFNYKKSITKLYVYTLISDMIYNRYKYKFAIGLLMLFHISIIFFWVSSMKNQTNNVASNSKSTTTVNNNEVISVKPLLEFFTNN